MKLTYFENPYELTDGRYLACFKDVEPYKNDKARGKDGNPIPEGLKWMFELVEGPDNGKVANVLTGKIPSKKNVLGRLIMAMSDDTLQDGLEFDVERFKGAYYRITVSDGYMTDSPPPRFQGFTRPVDASNQTPFDTQGSGDGKTNPERAEEPPVF